VIPVPGKGTNLLQMATIMRNLKDSSATLKINKQKSKTFEQIIHLKLSPTTEGECTLMPDPRYWELSIRHYQSFLA
jgi:hypothetical protein